MKFLGNQHLGFQFARRPKCNVKEMNQLGVRSPTTTFCYVGWNRYDCFFHLSRKPKKFFFWKCFTLLIGMYRNVNPIFPNL